MVFLSTLSSPLLHAGGKSMSQWLRSHQLLDCAESAGTREWGHAPRKGRLCRELLQGGAPTPSCSEASCKLSTLFPQVPQERVKRLICHTGWGASRQKEELTKYALLHHDTGTLRILKNKWEQDWFLQSFTSGVSIGWGQLEAADILQELVSLHCWELWACSCEGPGRR